MYFKRLTVVRKTYHVSSSASDSLVYGELCSKTQRSANGLGVSLDERAGRKEVSTENTIRNPELNRLYKKVDQLSDEDQKALLVVLDSLVKRSQVSKVMPEM